jgi:hypothetical protein
MEMVGRSAKRGDGAARSPHRGRRVSGAGARLAGGTVNNGVIGSRSSRSVLPDSACGGPVALLRSRTRVISVPDRVPDF